jgi:hypothetical protein
MATTNHNRLGQLACLARVEAAMADLERAIILTGVGAEEFNTMRLQAVILRTRTQDSRMPVGTAPAVAVPPRSREDQDRARGVMRPPRYQGD